MTEKRFIIPNQLRVIRDTVTGEEAIFYDTEDGLILEKWLNELHEENQELKRLVKVTVKDYTDLEQSFNLIDKENEQLQTKNNAYIQDIEVFKEENTHLKLENEQLQERLDELKTYDKEEFVEAEHINDIYKEKGFCGVIEYAKDKLQYYGIVKEVEKGLWIMVTGGWSDNEFWLHCLNNPISIFGMKHYRGYLRGGAFYYTEKPRGDVEIILKGDVE